MSSKTWLPQKLMIFTLFVFFSAGFTIPLNTVWYAASNPVVQIFDLKPSQLHVTTGIPSSLLAASTTASMSSPIIPEAHDVVTNIALGCSLSYASFIVSSSFCVRMFSLVCELYCLFEFFCSTEYSVFLEYIC